MLQVAEQPSPSFVLPSSQSSSLNLIPSPQGEVHAPLSQFGSSWQNGVQPSPRSLFASSQRSLPSDRPSPQVVLVQALPGFVQAYRSSRRQVSSQPSFAFALPSSQSSDP